MLEMKKIRKVIFPAGGFGTRFLPATKALPKEMLSVGKTPLIQLAFEEAKAAGIEQFIMITGRNKSAISNHFDHSYELNSASIETLLKSKSTISDIGILIVPVNETVPCTSICLTGSIPKC
jgi:UTP-glucose-1-phosphate uridylyltransferase